jgi:hypothetical protein
MRICLYWLRKILYHQINPQLMEETDVLFQKKPLSNREAVLDHRNNKKDHQAA